MPKVLVTPPAFIHKPGTYRDILERAGLDVVYPPPGVSLFDSAALKQA